MAFRNKADSGYASLTAIVLCAAVSILCAGAISVSDAQRKTESRRFERVQLEEAINSGVMRFSVEVAASKEQYELHGSRSVIVGDRTYVVSLVAQSEHGKWPLNKASGVDRAALSRAIRLSFDQVQRRISAGKRDDCIASLFSDIGQVGLDKNRPTSKGGLGMADGKIGQIWRIRAVSGSRVEERRVRFLGDPDHIYAIVSVDRMSLGEMPECTDLIVKG